MIYTPNVYLDHVLDLKNIHAEKNAVKLHLR